MDGWMDIFGLHKKIIIFGKNWNNLPPSRREIVQISLPSICKTYFSTSELFWHAKNYLVNWHQVVRMGVTIVVNCCPLLSIVIHCCPLLSTSAKICHDLLYHWLPHIATDWLKCFCLYRLKWSKAISGLDWAGLEISVSTSSKSTAMPIAIPWHPRALQHYSYTSANAHSSAWWNLGWNLGWK